MKPNFMIAHTFGFWVGLSILSQGATLFTDTFDSGTGNWYKGGSSGTLSNNAGQLSWQESGSDANEVIARQFSTSTLAVGETLRLTFNYTQTGASPVILRVGLFNLQNSITADGWNTGVTNIGGSVQGYTTFVRDNSNAGNNARYETGTIDSTTTHAPLNAGTNIGSLNTTQYDIVENGSLTYTVVFEVTLVSAGQMNTQFTMSSVNGTHFSIPATTSQIYNGFDTAALRITGGTALLDNVSVELIPEPSALLLSGFGASAFFLRRRRKS